MSQMSVKAHAGAILALGLPLMGSALAQIGIQLTDTVMLGRYDVRALAAQVLASALFFTLLITGAGFARAAMPLVAAGEAKGDRTEMRRATRMALWLSALFGAGAMPLFLYAEAILLFFQQEPDLAAGAARYLAIQGWSIFPALAIFTLRSTLSGMGRTGIVLIGTLTAVVANALGNWLLIFGALGAPELGLDGAAIASVFGVLVNLAVLVWWIRARLRAEAIFARLWRPDWEIFARLFQLGWPIGIATLAEAGLFHASTLMMGALGTVEVAAHGIALNIISVVFMVHVGLTEAATIRAAGSYGRGDLGEMRRGAAVVIGLSGAVALVTMATFLGVPRLLTGFFIDPADPVRPEILATGATLLAAAAVFQVADAAQLQGLGLLRAVQDTKVPMWYAALSYWVVGIPAAWLLGLILGLGGLGVWIGMATGLTLAGVLMQWRFWMRQAHTNGFAAYSTPTR